MSLNRVVPTELAKELQRRREEKHPFSIYIARTPPDVKDEKSTPVYEFINEELDSRSEVPKDHKDPLVRYRLVSPGTTWNIRVYKKILAFDLGGALLSYRESVEQKKVTLIKAEQIRALVKQAREKNMLVVIVSKNLDPQYVSLELRKKIEGFTLPEIFFKELALGLDIGYFCYANNDSREDIFEYLRIKHLYNLDEQIGRKNICFVDGDINNRLSPCHGSGFSTINIKSMDAYRLIEDFISVENFFPSYDVGYGDVSSSVSVSETPVVVTQAPKEQLPGAVASTPVESAQNAPVVIAHVPEEKKLPAAPASTPVGSIQGPSTLFQQRRRITEALAEVRSREDNEKSCCSNCCRIS